MLTRRKNLTKSSTKINIIKDGKRHLRVWWLQGELCAREDQRMVQQIKETIWNRSNRTSHHIHAIFDVMTWREPCWRYLTILTLLAAEGVGCSLPLWQGIPYVRYVIECWNFCYFPNFLLGLVMKRKFLGKYIFQTG